MKGSNEFQELLNIIRKVVASEFKNNKVRNFNVFWLEDIDCELGKSNSLFIRKKVKHYLIAPEGKDPKEGFITLSGIYDGQLNRLPVDMEGKPRPGLMPFNTKQFINGNDAQLDSYQGFVNACNACPKLKLRLVRTGLKFDPTEGYVSTHIVHQRSEEPPTPMDKVCEGCPFGLKEIMEKFKNFKK